MPSRLAIESVDHFTPPPPLRPDPSFGQCQHGQFWVPVVSCQVHSMSGARNGPGQTNKHGTMVDQPVRTPDRTATAAAAAVAWNHGMAMAAVPGRAHW